mgnify:CR=1 FL=1
MLLDRTSPQAEAPTQDRQESTPRLAASVSAQNLAGPRVSVPQEPDRYRRAEVRTVGELLEALKGLDPETPFVWKTEGHFRVTQRAELSLVAGDWQPTKPGKWGPAPDGEPIHAVALTPGKLWPDEPARKS